MDHMIPKMGVVAMMANALVGNNRMFENNSFDDFIPKPVDIN